MARRDDGPLNGFLSPVALGELLQIGLDRLTLNMRHDRIKMTSHQDHGVELVHIQEEIPHVDGWEQGIWEEVEEATNHIVPLLKIPEQTVTERGTSDSRCTAHHVMSFVLKLHSWYLLCLGFSSVLFRDFSCFWETLVRHYTIGIPIGVVFGDLGTSPLYVLSSTFPNGIQDPDDIFGVLSVIIYSIFIITIGKYTFMVLFANNKGDGGTFAMYALISRYMDIRLTPSHQVGDREQHKASRSIGQDRQTLAMTTVQLKY
ncbi:hypothetical protein DKX38_013474 [Salix brachista]|uniref:K+ potassium transporter integral membrane domain-containing protein n=1 Tax=Salix brachista TaxID=2182728 RepID=A0A5N5LRZ9_9ROSI|nr:hypothetical protein DKX38_013474 [Salix brachista]